MAFVVVVLDFIFCFYFVKDEKNLFLVKIQNFQLWDFFVFDNNNWITTKLKINQMRDEFKFVYIKIWLIWLMNVQKIIGFIFSFIVSDL